MKIKAGKERIQVSFGFEHKKWLSLNGMLNQRKFTMIISE